jgi:hypothetical protein
MFIALERELQRQQFPLLRAHDDRLAHFSELDEMEIWAADGHHIAHATHDSRNEKDAYCPVNAIFKFDLLQQHSRRLAADHRQLPGQRRDLHHPDQPDDTFTRSAQPIPPIATFP